MTSPHWDESRADAYRRFQFEFPERPLAGAAIALAGGSGGLGAATAALLIREGANLIIGYRSNRDRAENLRNALTADSNVKIELVGGDLSVPEVRRAYLAAAEKLGPPLSGLVVFAGDPARVPAESLDRDAMLASLDVNYVGPVLLARDLGAAMEPSPRGGRVVLLSTMQSTSVFPGSLNYAPPKAALQHAACILAQQWSNVSVNVVAPGATISGMAAASVQSGKYDQQIASGAVSRFGRPEDVARAVRFFLEPDNYVTGQTLTVDGGLTLRRHRR
jgi:3-oxoacyl-[acyl-carrier protein] reductase